MGTRQRTRPDEASRPSYITREGYRRLEEEAHRLWTVERPKLTRAVAIAAAEGDRSENAEYIYGKKKLGEIDRRLRYLGKRLTHLTIVEDQPPNTERVYFGAFVTLEDEAGDQVTYRIVGPDETDAAQGYISIESPVAKALIGRHCGDDVRVPTPKGVNEWVIESVRYGAKTGAS